MKNRKHNRQTRTSGKKPRGNPAHRHQTATDRLPIYGIHAALAACANPRRRILDIHATASIARNHEHALRRCGAPLTILPPGEISRLAPPGAVHQGLLVTAAPLPPLGMDDLDARGIVLVLDQITDPHNVGAILRSAAAFDVRALIMTSRNSPAAAGVLAKTASGALEHVPLIGVANLARAMQQLGQTGFARIGLDSDGTAVLEQTPLATPPLALALGAEGKGLRRLTREHCDAIARLDMPGAIKSLNVSNAAAIALYALHCNRETH